MSQARLLSSVAQPLTLLLAVSLHAELRTLSASCPSP